MKDYDKCVLCDRVWDKDTGKEMPEDFEIPYDADVIYDNCYECRSEPGNNLIDVIVDIYADGISKNKEGGK